MCVCRIGAGGERRFLGAYLLRSHKRSIRTIVVCLYSLYSITTLDCEMKTKDMSSLIQSKIAKSDKILCRNIFDHRFLCLVRLSPVHIRRKGEQNISLCLPTSEKSETRLSSGTKVYFAYLFLILFISIVHMNKVVLSQAFLKTRKGLMGDCVWMTQRCHLLTAHFGLKTLDLPRTAQFYTKLASKTQPMAGCANRSEA